MAQPSRRALLRAGVIGAAFAGVSGISGTASAAAPRRRRAARPAPPPPTRLRRSVFAPHVGTTFSLVGGGRTHFATLVSVGDHYKSIAGDETRFTLLFHVDGAPAEGVYAVGNAKLRAVALFLAPVTGRRGVVEAVIAS